MFIEPAKLIEKMNKNTNHEGLENRPTKPFFIQNQEAKEPIKLESIFDIKSSSQGEQSSDNEQTPALKNQLTQEINTSIFRQIQQNSDFYERKIKRSFKK